MEVDLKRLFQWHPVSALQGFGVMIEFKIVSLPGGTPGTLATIEGKRKFALRINSSNKLEVVYKISGNEETLELNATLTALTSVNDRHYAVFGYISNKIDPSKSVVYLSTTKNTNNKAITKIINGKKIIFLRF